MRGRYRQLLALVAPVVTVLLRLPFLLSRDGLYGLDPYFHLYLVKVWLRLSSWSLLGGAEDIIPSDYNAWPGCHVVAASVSSLGPEPMAVLTWTPVLFLFLLDLLIVLVLLRRTDLLFATIGGVVFGLLDFMFFQTQWYVPELLGLVLIAALVLNQLTIRHHHLALVLLVAVLLTHHLSFLIALVFWVLLTPSRTDRDHLVMAVVLAIATFLMWDLALDHTGSFPDIQNQIGGLHPALVAIGIMMGLMVLKWVGSVALERYLPIPDGSTVLEALRERSRFLGTTSVALLFVAAAVAILAIYLPSAGRFDGIGIQPSKLIMLAGGFLFVAFVPMDRDLLRVLAAFGLVLALFILNPLLFDFLPLTVRFLDFLYIPGIVLLVTGAFHLALRYPERTRAVLLALVLVCPVLCVDDALRYMSDDSQRFAYSSEDLEFAEMVGERTEPEARIVTPFGLAGVVVGISERPTSTHPIRAALDGDGYVDALPFLNELAANSSLYLVHSSDLTMYIETEDDHVSQDDLDDLEASLDQISDRLALVIDEEGHDLYRFR